LFNNFTGLLRVLDQNKWYPKYVFYSLYGNYRRGGTRSFENKTTGLHNLKTDDYVSRYEVKETEYARQVEISNHLDKLYSIIKLREEELLKMDDLIKARFVELFGSIHDGRFDMKTLPEIVSDDKNSIKRGPFGGALKKDDFVEEGYLVYEQRHAIHNDFEYAKYYITQEKYDDMIGFKVIPGDLIISCSGVTLGRIAEVPEGAKEGIINQALLKLSLNPDVMLNTFFIQQFRGEEIQEILFGFSRGSGIPNMPSMSEVKAVKFICPPLELQKQYCDFVKQVDKSKYTVEKALIEAQTLFDSLMQ
jgi:type I restriction enzyme S subunit